MALIPIVDSSSVIAASDAVLTELAEATKNKAAQAATSNTVKEAATQIASAVKSKITDVVSSRITTVSNILEQCPLPNETIGQVTHKIASEAEQAVVETVKHNVAEGTKELLNEIGENAKDAMVEKAKDILKEGGTQAVEGILSNLYETGASYASTLANFAVANAQPIGVGVFMAGAAYVIGYSAYQRYKDNDSDDNNQPNEKQSKSDQKRNYSTTL
ncbi:MAG: hypothetical protein JSS07_10255 [Proteobacteria bacterium]|nr:hypothetical protein [Pseudomonadota bacterium]